MDITVVHPWGESPPPNSPFDICFADSEMLETLLPFQLGRYRLESLIGQGGMARVFRAVLLGPAGFEKTVAIKLMTMVRTDKASADFRREAVYASRIHHPNVVDVYELGDAEGCPFIAMEWVAGESLHHLLQTRGPPPGSAALDLMVALLNGLEQAHRGDPASQRPGMLHRDIKPSNIIISRFGVPKLLDFGIAVQMAGPDSSLVPAEGRVIGTLNWMSPEQIQGHALDERSDLFSFGLIIANIVLGRNPLRPGYLRDQVTAQAPIPNGLLKPEDQSALDARIPGLGAIVASTLRRDVNERPRNAFQLRKALQALRPAVGHRPSLPQWMTERDPSHPPKDPPPMGSQTTWVMGQPERISELDTETIVAGNIPTDEQLFVGRIEEFAVLESHLLEGRSLVSLVGPGGAGKTRLGRRIANRFSGHLAGGAWFVDLSDVEDTDGIVRAVAAALKLSLPVATHADPVALLGEQLADQPHLLLVLDNFEQLVEYGPETVGRWLQQAPHVQFLLTTREGLLLPDETLVALAPLSVDEAVELLRARAKLAGADWDERTASHKDLVAIVESLDRLPLAIELAAARARMMTPSVLHQRLAERFKLLAGRQRGRRERQASLYNLVDWSWQRLEPWEQSALAQLSCFRGGFEMDAAEAIVDLSAWPEAPWSLDVIGALLDKSLLHSQIIDDHPRLKMYVSIRAFATQRLAEDHFPITGARVASGAIARHARYFSGLSPIEITGSLRMPDPSARRKRYVDFENLLAATHTAPQPQRTLCAVGALEVLMSRGPMSQALTLIDRLLGDDSVPTLLALRLRTIQARCLRLVGRPTEAQAALAAGSELAQQAAMAPTSDALLELNEEASALPGGTASTLSFEIDSRLEQARLLRGQGRNEEAEALLKGALAMCSPTRTPTLQARVQLALGTLLWTMGKAHESVSTLRESRTAFRVAGLKGDEGLVLSSLAYVLYQMGKVLTAHPMLLESVELLKQSANPSDARQALGKLANIESYIGKRLQALAHYDEALTLHAQVGDVMNASLHRINRAHLLIEAGRVEEAETELNEVATVCRQREARLHEAMAIKSLGQLYLDQARYAESITAFRFAYEAFRGKIPMVAASVGLDLVVAHARSGDIETVNALEELTLGTEEHVDEYPTGLLLQLRNLAEIRLAQGHLDRARQHIQGARAAADRIEGGGCPKDLQALDELERRLEEAE